MLEAGDLRPTRMRVLQRLCGEGARPAPRILLADPDPYTAFLIRLDLPGAVVIEAPHDAGIDQLLESEPDVILFELFGPRAVDVLSGHTGSKLIGILDGHLAGKVGDRSGLDETLLRPFVPAELSRAIRCALGVAADEPRPAFSADRLRSWAGKACLAAVAIAAVLELAAPRLSALGAVAFAAAFGYSVLRTRGDAGAPRWAWAHVGFATVLLAATGGIGSSYVLLAIIIAAEAGARLGSRAGTVAGAAIFVGSAPQAVAGLVANEVSPGLLVAYLAIFPLAGIAGGLAARIWMQGGEGLGLLTEANRVLGTLHRIARSMPGGLDVRSVAAASLDEARETLGAPAGAVLVAQSGILNVAGSFGMSPTQGIAGQEPGVAALLGRGGSRVIEAGALPPPLKSLAAGHGCWIVSSLRHRGANLGLMLVACGNHSQHDFTRLCVDRLAVETAVALENARLFGRVRELSVDDERRRFARELHDGVVQSLIHIRLELDFLSRRGAQSARALRAEAARLSRVVERAVEDVRTTMIGLKSAVNGEGLAGSLRSYLADLRGVDGPQISFFADGESSLDAAQEREVFRIAQEAVSNAMRHARASEICVVLEAEDYGLRLTVSDDGDGIGNGSREGGMGLQAMRERAVALGAKLLMGTGPEGGTRVELRVGRTLPEVKYA